MDLNLKNTHFILEGGNVQRFYKKADNLACLATLLNETAELTADVFTQ